MFDSILDNFKESFFNSYGKYSLQVNKKDGKYFIAYNFEDDNGEDTVIGSGETLYEAIDNVIEKTAALFSEDKEEYYEALEREELLEIIEEQNKTIETLKNSLDDTEDFYADKDEKIQSLIAENNRLREQIDDLYIDLKKVSEKNKELSRISMTNFSKFIGSLGE